MPNYAKSKIYQIISPNYPVPYIGSTTLPLCNRMSTHRSHAKNKYKGFGGLTSSVVINAGDAYIELIEEFPCENREQLSKREGEIIRERDCVNHRIPGRPFSEYARENYHDNIERERERSKQYYQNNKEAIAKRMRAYYVKNHPSKQIETDNEREQWEIQQRDHPLHVQHRQQSTE